MWSGIVEIGARWKMPSDKCPIPHIREILTSISDVRKLRLSGITSVLTIHFCGLVLTRHLSASVLARPSVGLFTRKVWPLPSGGFGPGLRRMLGFRLTSTKRAAAIISKPIKIGGLFSGIRSSTPLGHNNIKL